MATCAHGETQSLRANRQGGRRKKINENEKRKHNLDGKSGNTEGMRAAHCHWGD